MSKCGMWTKNHQREIKFGSIRKLDIERTMKGLGKPFRNKSNPKIEK